MSIELIEALTVSMRVADNEGQLDDKQLNLIGDHINDLASKLIVFPCYIKFTIHTYSGTSRSAVWLCMAQSVIDDHIEFYMSNTTGQTKNVTYELHVMP